MPVVIPTLGPDHWAISPIKKFDYMMSHFFVCEYSQTYLFRTSITSLPWIVQETSGDMPACCALIQTSLERYLRRAFNNVVVDVAEIETQDNLMSEVRIYVSCTDEDGTVINLGKMVRTEAGMIKEIIDLLST